MASAIFSTLQCFLLCTDELEKRGYFDQLKSLTEEMYRRNGRTKVTLVVHSMGGPVSLHFLTSFSGINQAWKDKHIHAYVPISGAWAGATGAVQSVISRIHGGSLPGFLMFARGIIDKYAIPIARKIQSLPWLFPKSSVFGNTVIVSTPSKGYRINDYEELFSDIGYTNGYRFFQGVQGINLNYPAPNVPTYCYYGVNVKTPKKYRYSKDFKPGKSTIGLKPKITFGNGDSTVNIESSRVCHAWSSMRHPFTFKGYSKVNHVNIVGNSRVLADIASIVGARKKKSFWERLFG